MSVFRVQDSLLGKLRTAQNGSKKTIFVIYRKKEWENKAENLRNVGLVLRNMMSIFIRGLA